MSDRVKIAVIDDHQIFLDGVSLLVKSMDERFEVCGFSAPMTLLSEVKTGAKFDLVLCDLIMNSMNGLAFISALRAHAKTLPILMLSGINTAPPLAEIKRLGGQGFVHKSVDNQNLLSAIQTVLAGGTYFADGLEAGKINAPIAIAQDGMDDPVVTPQLSGRQMEVLGLIANGASNKEIARTLSISENTVKTYLKQIFLELGVNKRTACVRKAQMLGLI